MKKRIPIPAMAGEYTRIYTPGPDTYLGPDTAHYKNGTAYDSWTVNDFSTGREGNTFYLTGITHPTPAGLEPDGFIYDPSTIHEAEFQFFLASLEGDSMGELTQKAKAGDGLRDLPKLLWHFQRPDERPEAHAPHMMKIEGGWRLVYGPREFRCADFDEDFHLVSRRVLFTDEASSRDPFVFYENGLWYIFYAVANRTQYRTSEDFTTWSEAHILQVNPYRDGANESPCFIKKNGFYYLFWSIWDDRNGSYDARTFVFGGESIEDLADTAPLTILPAHAPEIVSDASGDWLLSVFYPENGISAAPLTWL